MSDPGLDELEWIASVFRQAEQLQTTMQSNTRIPAGPRKAADDYLRMAVGCLKVALENR